MIIVLLKSRIIVLQRTPFRTVIGRGFFFITTTNVSDDRLSVYGPSADSRRDKRKKNLVVIVVGNVPQIVLFFFFIQFLLSIEAKMKKETTTNDFA